MQKSELVLVNNRVYHLGITSEQVASNIFLVGDPARAYKIAESFDTVDHEVGNREYITLSGSYQGMPLSVIGTGIGTDNVEIALIEVYNALCFDFESASLKKEIPKINVIRIGTSGGVQGDIAAGTMAIASYGLGLDSTGLFYDHPAVDQIVLEIEEQCYKLLTQSTAPSARFRGKIVPYASKATTEVVATMTEVANSLDIPYCEGITVSSPGFYGPSGRFIEGLHNTVPDIKLKLANLNLDGLRIVNMEMESSLIFHLCGHLGIRCGTICPIISNPNTSTALVNYHTIIQQAIDIGLTTMLKIANS